MVPTNPNPSKTLDFLPSKRERDSDTVQKEGANGRSMRWSQFFVVALLLTTTSIAGASSSKGVISCSNSNLESLPGNWSLGDQACIRVDLGVHDPGTTLFFDISSDEEIDIFLFPSNTVSVYQNEQSYRLDSVWVSESVFESFSGSGEWHWEVPGDRDSTRWYLVVDNLAHPQDSGEGSQGGQPAEITLDGGVIDPQQFTLSDSIHRVSPGDYSVVHGPFPVDEGTFVEIHARTMEGFPDIFIMTETAFSYYSPSSNWSSSLRIVSADMLQVSNERYLPWEASETNGEDLYIVVDNRPGPGGGGAGNSMVAVTVTVTLTPILEPTISSPTDLDSVDVGSTVTLSALETPNKSHQILDSGYSWDINNDGTPDAKGATIEHVWEAPGNYTVRLSATSVDSRSASNTRVVTVLDTSDPVVSMGVTGQITKGFGEQLVVSATFTDNWGVERLDWLIDGTVVWSNYSVTEPSSTLFLDVSDGYSAGPHTVSLVVVDKSGRNTTEDFQVIFIDVTAPEIAYYESQIEVISGDPIILQIFAQDNESERIDYTWTIEQGTENEIQFNGPQLIYKFSEPGPNTVFCKVENDAGLASYAEILVLVESPETEDGSGLITIAIISVVLFSVLVVVGVYAFNTFVVRRMEKLTEPEAVEGDENPPQPSTQSQMQMWGGGSSSSPFQAPTEMPRRTNQETDLMDLLEVEKTTQETSPKASDSSLLNDLQDTPTKPDPGEMEGTKVRKECEQCSRPFAIVLPKGVEAAYTNCPYCGSEELVSFRHAQ